MYTNELMTSLGTRISPMIRTECRHMFWVEGEVILKVANVGCVEDTPDDSLSVRYSVA